MAVRDYHGRGSSPTKMSAANEALNKLLSVQIGGVGHTAALAGFVVVFLSYCSTFASLFSFKRSFRD